MHILEREDREFEEAIRGQVGTTFSITNSSNKMESFKSAYQDHNYHPVYNKEEVKIRLCLPLRSINFYRDKLTTVSCLYLGLNPSLGTMEAALS